jgi:SHS2 domain-containing protein
MAIARAEVAARAATAMADIAFDIDTIEPAHGIALELPNRRPAC